MPLLRDCVISIAGAVAILILIAAGAGYLLMLATEAGRNTVPVWVSILGILISIGGAYGIGIILLPHITREPTEGSAMPAIHPQDAPLRDLTYDQLLQRIDADRADPAVPPRVRKTLDEARARLTVRPKGGA